MFLLLMNALAQGNTSMKRLLLLLGPILSVAGALGLIVFGDAIVGVFECVLTYGIVGPPQPVPISLGDLRWGAISGTAMTVGLVVSCVATAMRDSQSAMSLAGRIFQVVAGFLLLVGTVPVLWGIVIAKRGFIMIATSATTPKPDDVREMVQSATPMLTVGCGVLVVGVVVLLVVGQVGVRTKTPQTSDALSILSTLAAIGSSVLAVVSSFLFVGLWFHENALEAFLTSSGATPKPSELAQHLTGVLNKSLLAFIAVGCQGVLQAVAAIFTPASGPGAVSENLTDYKPEQDVE